MFIEFVPYGTWYEDVLVPLARNHDIFAIALLHFANSGRDVVIWLDAQMTIQYEECLSYVRDETLLTLRNEWEQETSRRLSTQMTYEVLSDTANIHRPQNETARPLSDFREVPNSQKAIKDKLLRNAVWVRIGNYVE